MLDKFKKQGGVVIKVDGSAAIGDVTLQVYSAVRNRILAQRENNFYLRPTLEEPRSPTLVS